MIRIAIFTTNNTEFLEDIHATTWDSDPAAELEEVEAMIKSGDYTIAEISLYLSDKRRKSK